MGFSTQVFFFSLYETNGHIHAVLCNCYFLHSLQLKGNPGVKRGACGISSDRLKKQLKSVSVQLYA